MKGFNNHLKSNLVIILGILISRLQAKPENPLQHWPVLPYYFFPLFHPELVSLQMVSGCRMRSALSQWRLSNGDSYCVMVRVREQGQLKLEKSAAHAKGVLRRGGRLGHPWGGYL